MGFESSFGFRQPPGIQEGKDLERGMLGKPNEVLAAEGYKTYNESLREVLEADPGKLSDSIQTLKSAVFNKVNPQNGFIKVRSALGTPLDIYHGVDFIMEYEGKIVTIDITSNTEKIVSGAKADIILSATLDDDGIPQIDPVSLDSASSKIARQLLGDMSAFKQAA